MRIIIIFILGIAALMVCADETLPVLKVGKDTYNHVTVFKVSATDIFFTSDQGIANVKLKSLTPELQKHFNFSPTNTAMADQKQKLAADPYHRQLVAESAKDPGTASLKLELYDAVSRVKQIVNQPVRQLTRTPGMSVATYSPGWFHSGAEKPDFKTVDVRATQKLDYAKDQYVTSDLNPGVVFSGSEIEFNPMTKRFYTDMTLPKKKLTEEEMLEINRLYRVIGRDEEQLLQKQK